MRDALEKLKSEATKRIAGARGIEGLEALEIEFLGRKQGKLTAVLRGLGALPPEERKSIGALANQVKAGIEALFTERRSAFLQRHFSNLAEAEWIDTTAPGSGLARGHLHPVGEAIRDISAIFERIGFIRSRHPEADSDFYAFESLNMPPDHPARDEWETFFVKPEAGSWKLEAGRIVLTPHTSNGQVREMEKGYLPIRMVSIGKCYRRQMDVSHVPMFHQFEGLLIDKNVAVSHLKGTLDYFARSYFGPDRRTRLRPHHFQFTEPSFEIDVSCAVCGGTGAVDRAKCRVCKSGWLELGGAGMVHPNVLRAGKIDPKKYSGFAFGWGVERVLMMKTGINDIRLLYGNDLRWLKQW